MEISGPSYSVAANTPASRPQPAKDLILICCLCLFLLGPFLNRPLHVDDPVYVRVANQIRLHPLEFYSFHLNWQGHDQPVSGFLESPPLICFVIAAISAVASAQPLPLHLGMLILNLLSAVGMYFLARQYCRRPLLAASLLLLCPAFAVSATTIMCEPLLMFCWIWAVLFWTLGTDRHSSLLPLSGLLILAAFLTKFLAIALVPLCSLYMVLRPVSRQTRAIQCLSLMIPILGAGVYEAYTRHLYGAGGFEGAMTYATASQQVIAIPPSVKLLNGLCFLGGSGAAVVFFLPLVLRRYQTAAFLAFAVAAAVWSASNLVPFPGWIARSNVPVRRFSTGIGYFSQSAFWLTGGLGITAFTINRLVLSIRRRQTLGEPFLIAWIAGIFLFAGFVNWSVNSRSMLPMLPALCILVVRQLDSVSSLPKAPVAVVFVLSALLALTLVHADYSLACTIKQAAAETSQAASSLRAHDAKESSIWFAGHWGFQYYIEPTGARPIDDRFPRLGVGDYVIYPEGCYGGVPSLKQFLFLRHMDIGPARWASTFQVELGANFYSSAGYSMPFVFGPVPPEGFDIFQVLPQSRIRP